MTRYAWSSPAAVALLLALIVTYALVRQPGYTDAFYYTNAANRLVSGDGLTDPYLWSYIGAPDSLPAPSHLYWMPGASLIAAAGMGLLWAPGAYWAAQVPFALLLALVGMCAYWLGMRLGGTSRHAWAALLIVLGGGFYSRFWGMVSTFTPFAAFGAGCLIALGRGLETRNWVWFLLAGALAGGAHLTRADGVLLVLAGTAAVVWMLLWSQAWRAVPMTAVRAVAVLLVGYGVVMSPWFVRNLNALGTPLPTDGAQGIWFTEYNDIFNYLPDATPQRFFEMGGWSLLLESRRVGLANGLATFAVVQGMVVLTPLMLLALWRRARLPLLTPFWVYALGLHLAMMLVFPFPGYRGGLFHSAAALMPFWVALALVGLDDAVDWLARRRRHWNAAEAKRLFTVGLVLVCVGLSVYVGWGGRARAGTPALYTTLQDVLPPDARVLVNDPAQLYYYTGHGGVVLPNEVPDVLREVAALYGVDYLLLEQVSEDGIAFAAPTPLVNIPANPPDFLTPLPLAHPNVRLYRIEALDRAP